MVSVRAYVGAVAANGQAPATGITVIDVNGSAVTPVATTAAGALSPMWLAAGPDHSVLYAAHAIADGKISAWRVAGDELHAIGPARASGGAVPCHLSVHPSGRHLLTANYRDGTIAVHPIHDDGRLGAASHVLQHVGAGPHPERQRGPHPHMITTDPAQGQVLVADLGTDAVHRYQLSEHGQLTPIDHVQLPPGTGPRHLVTRGRYAYVAGELASTICVIDLTASPPALVATASTRTSTHPRPNHPSAVVMSRDGRLLHVANRGDNTVVTFTVDGADIVMAGSVDCGGDTPWDLAVVDDHLYAANQRSNNLAVFRIDPATGLPGAAGGSYRLPSPVRILAWP